VNPNAPQIGRTFGFTVRIDASQRVVVQRSVKFLWRSLPVNDGMFAQLPATRFANTWVFAAGSTNNDTANNKLNDMAYNIYNPNNLAVRLKFTYYSASGVISTAYTYLNPSGRTRIQPNAKPFAGYPSIGPGFPVVAVKIESVDQNGTPVLNLPVFAERVLYWTWGASINGGNAVYGYNPPGT
jgi:hypothetical protein